jgi:hypothetical protein
MNKIDKYTPLLPVLAERFKTNPGKVLPIFVGCRGGDPKKYNHILERTADT